MRLLLILSAVLALAVPAASLGHTNGSSGSTTTEVVAKKKKKKKQKSARKSVTSSSTSRREREVKGTISALSASSITVGPLTCSIPTGRVLTGFAVNDFVELECKQLGGVWTLRKVKHEDHGDDEREVKGKIAALSAGSITVGSLTCAIPTGVALTGFAVGDLVELKCRKVAANWTLRRVKHEDDDGDDEREVKGKIAALSAGSITVGSLTCAIPAGVTTSGFVVGDFVELECRRAGGTLTLSKLKHEDDDDSSSRDDDDDDEGEDDDDDHSGSGHDGDDDDDNSGSGSDDD